jgi:hypothetical protein
MMSANLTGLFNSKASPRPANQENPSSVDPSPDLPIERTHSPSIQDEANLGLQTLCQPPDAVVDVVFVHGLTGNTFNTWYEERARIYWPRDLLRSDIADARVFSFGYNADVTSFWGQTSKNRLGEHAKNLLGDLVREREETDTVYEALRFLLNSKANMQ